MKLLSLFCAMAGLLLTSPVPPPASAVADERPRCLAQAGCGQPAAINPAAHPVPASVPRPASVVPPAPPPATPPVAPEPPPEPVPGAPGEGLRIVVSIPEQQVYVFEDGALLATSPVSTGRRGHETPVGTFRILQKKTHHRSNLYDDAPMPFMQRLTWRGVALHAGRVPGYPASHGCIRLPRWFAKKLYGLTDFDTWVTVTDQSPETPEDALSLA